MSEKKKLSQLFRIKEVEISQFPVFIGYGHLQYERYGWRGLHGLRYHSYLIPAIYELNDAVALAQGVSFSAQKRAATHKKEQEPHENVGNAKEVEESDNVNEEKKEVSDAECTASAEVSSWKISTSSVSGDQFLVFFFPQIEVEPT